MNSSDESEIKDTLELVHIAELQQVSFVYAQRPVNLILMHGTIDVDGVGE